MKPLPFRLDSMNDSLFKVCIEDFILWPKTFVLFNAFLSNIKSEDSNLNSQGNCISKTLEGLLCCFCDVQESRKHDLTGYLLGLELLRCLRLHHWDSLHGQLCQLQGIGSASASIFTNHFSSLIELRNGIPYDIATVCL